GNTEPMAQVIAFLRTRQMLLVFDNFEHLAAEAAILDRLLSECPRLKILVTSRVRMALASEWLLPLEGLPCPEEEDEENIESFDAARLFVRAARRVQPELSPVAEAAAIVDICQQVQGLPLALELAAAWTRVLSCSAIADELRHGTELLHAADGLQPSRHASIDVVFEQSWRLLTDIERKALARLSVFRGGFSPAAARAVTNAPLPVLGALADKSLLHRHADRLLLHPLVQQLAAARLGDAESASETAASHAAFFHRFLAQLRSTTESGNRQALHLIDEDVENCRRAWQWAIAHGHSELLKQSSRTLLDYWDYRGRSEDGLALLREAIDSPVAEADPSLQALLLSRAAHLEYRLDRYGEAEGHAKRVLTMTRRGGDRDARLQALNVLGTCAYRMGRLTEAKRYFTQRLGLASPAEQAHTTAVTLDHLALVEKQLGHYPEALRLSLQSLAEHRRLGDSAGEALCLNNLGSLQLVMRENEAAEAHLREGLAICERDGLSSTKSFILSNLTEAVMRSGDLASAQALADRGIETATATGNRAVAAWSQLKAARLASRRRELPEARTMLADALRVILSVGVPSLKIDSLACFAEILAAQGEGSCASAVLDFAIGHPSATASDREGLRAVATQLSGLEASLPWAGLELDDLLERVVVEANLAYAPLITRLRGAH
ncbi:MAG: ATP-binding protein, partial [Burkholderiaceae bacterium]